MVPVPFTTTVPVNPPGPTLGVTVEPFVIPLTSPAFRFSRNEGAAPVAKVVNVKSPEIARLP